MKQTILLPSAINFNESDDQILRITKYLQTLYVKRNYLSETTIMTVSKVSEIVITFAVDVTHPKLYAKKSSYSDEPSIFAVYTGQTCFEANTSNESSLRIPIQEFLNIIRIPDSNNNIDINSTIEDMKSENIYEEALNLLDAMVSHIVSSVHI
ncbi:hypothetical protein MN116_008141 [Schistosoma mekongi]|uniref:Uncharacterized protein n=1 Tax=Schistosoma mekongi TaxID=38744 RepID=A0AAE1Z6S2_SCHME|nr:hypothetical protein MN116_008141 [Schistosoma mekongi]